MAKTVRIISPGMRASGHVGGVSASGGADGSRGSNRPRRRNRRGNVKCLASSMAEYKMTFYGAWSPDKFPRMYPRYRPPAQWSKLVGRSHGSTYNMWRLGQVADPALKLFAESGDSVLYDSQPQGYHGVLDSFSAEPIPSGEGRTSTFIMADGRHSRVSFVVKLVPSPDWFVGVENLELCRRGRWRARAHVNLRPVDAGTDRGYTFTSPNWPSVPREPIYQIMSTYPDHPASAFLYPEYPRLPRVAYVHFQRVAKYLLKGPMSPLKGNHTNNLQIFGKKPAPSTVAATIITTPSSATTVLSTAQIDNTSTEITKRLTQTTTATAPPKGFAEEPADCRVKEWSVWSACSKTCGFGVRTRSRHVLQHSAYGGLPCPILEQETLCGSMRNCQWQHFSFLSDRKRSRRLRRGRNQHERHHRMLRRRPIRRDE